MTRNRDIADFLGKTEASNTDNTRLSTAIEIDSSLVTSLVDSAYIILRDRVRDSGFITNIIDSSYIQLRENNSSAGLDSAAITSLIDSSYVQNRESPAAAGTDSAATINIIEDELSTFSIGDLVGADGNPGDTLISDGDGTATFTSLGARSLEFKVTYIRDSDLARSIIDSVQSLPTGFTLDSQGNESLIISHNLGLSVKDVTFNRYVGGTLKLKRSDSADLVTYLVADRLNKFTLRAGLPSTGADSAQYSYVNMIF